MVHKHVRFVGCDLVEGIFRLLHSDYALNPKRVKIIRKSRLSSLRKKLLLNQTTQR
jgi:hypothetical protein